MKDGSNNDRSTVVGEDATAGKFLLRRKGSAVSKPKAPQPRRSFLTSKTIQLVKWGVRNRKPSSWELFPKVEDLPGEFSPSGVKLNVAKLDTGGFKYSLRMYGQLPNLELPAAAYEIVTTEGLGVELWVEHDRVREGIENPDLAFVLVEYAKLITNTLKSEDLGHKRELNYFKVLHRAWDAAASVIQTKVTAVA